MVKIFVLIFALFINSCANNQYQEGSENIRGALMSGKVRKALKLSESEEFHKDETVELLKLLERGVIQHYAGKIDRSIRTFEKAKQKSDDLFTKSIKRKALSYIINDNSDNYYSMKFEQSQIRFYLSLNYLLKAHDLKLSKAQRKEYLVKARAVNLEWDSLMDNFVEVYKGKPIFKNDMAQKLLASFVHQELSGDNEKQIATKLMDEADTLLFQNYNLYQAFNKRYVYFRKYFHRLHKLDRNLISRKLVKYSNESKKLRRMLASEKRGIKNKKLKSNVLFVINNGLIAEKYKRSVGITSSLKKDQNFVDETKNFGAKVYDLPEIDMRPTRFSMNYKFRNIKTKDVLKAPLTIVNPLSQIAYENFQDLKRKISRKTLVRKASKYAAATGLAAASVLALSKKESAGVGIALGILAGVAYLFAGSSEKPDLRYWSALPHDIRMSRIRLPAGSYLGWIEIVNMGKVIQKIKTGKFQIKAGEQHAFSYKI